MELRFTVWQFVRLMVHLEETPDAALNPSADGASPEKALLTAWADIWQPLDQELGELAERDFEAYGELMMDQDVVIENAAPEQVKTVERALNRVMAQMDQALKDGGEPAHLQNLKFERRELRQLARKLGRANAEQTALGETPENKN